MSYPYNRPFECRLWVDEQESGYRILYLQVNLKKGNLDQVNALSKAILADGLADEVCVTVIRDFKETKTEVDAQMAQDGNSESASKSALLEFLKAPLAVKPSAGN